MLVSDKNFDLVKSCNLWPSTLSIWMKNMKVLQVHDSLIIQVHVTGKELHRHLHHSSPFDKLLYKYKTAEVFFTHISHFTHNNHFKHKSFIYWQPQMPIPTQVQKVNTYIQCFPNLPNPIHWHTAFDGRNHGPSSTNSSACTTKR